jgi:hypothetical protein
VTIDAIAGERHFIDHLAPVWRALAEGGHFMTIPGLVDHAHARGIDAIVLDDAAQGSGPTIVASHGDLVRGRRLGRGPFALFQHGIGQSYGNGHPSYPGGWDNGDVELFLSPNDYATHHWAAVYPDAEAYTVGSPRLEQLPGRIGDPDGTVAVGFHWNCHLVPETRTAFAAFRNALVPLARSRHVLGHGHPRILDEISPYYRRAGIEVVDDFAEICRRADVYVCDNSSTLYEFAATDRPVVVLNAPWYRRTVNPGLRFWDAIPGIQVDRPEDLAAGIDAALLDPPEQRTGRERALALVYPERSAPNAPRASEVAAQLLELWHAGAVGRAA